MMSDRGFMSEMTQFVMAKSSAIVNNVVVGVHWRISVPGGTTV